jgi:hypothetical protein
MIQHMYRKKRCDFEHAVWIAANYRKYFPVGRAKPVQQQPSVAEVAVGQQHDTSYVHPFLDTFTSNKY